MSGMAMELLSQLKAESLEKQLVLRADFDALPIVEETACTVQIEKCWCHACMRT